MGPLTKCEFCKQKPGTRVERIASMALSIECLKEHNLKKGSAYIKKTKRLPKFHESIERKAIQLVEAHLEVDEPKEFDSADLSSAFFEFDFSQGSGGEKITVHAIGKPENVSDEHRGDSKRNTYHTMQWEVGKDISAEIADANVDPAGEIFVWYRWMGKSWTWKCVSRVEFEQLKSVDS
jgi:hypothetical protein